MPAARAAPRSPRSSRRSKLLDGLLPEQNYWPPVASGTQPAAQLFDFGDGGNLENYGLLPLIMRGVKKVLLFINTETPLEPHLRSDDRHGDARTISTPNFPPLFGIPVTSLSARAPTTTRSSRASDYAPLVQAMQALKQNGPADGRARRRTPSRPIRYWGIPAGGTIDVLYVYLDQVEVVEVADHG